MQCKAHCIEPIFFGSKGAQPPNKDPSLDAMISILAHELAEVATDPEFSAWFDDSGEENADKCLRSFGSANASNPVNLVGAQGSRFLVQQNWDVNSQSCITGLPQGPKLPRSKKKGKKKNKK